MDTDDVPNEETNDHMTTSDTDLSDEDMLDDSDSAAFTGGNQTGHSGIQNIGNSCYSNSVLQGMHKRLC